MDRLLATLVLVHVLTAIATTPGVGGAQLSNLLGRTKPDAPQVELPLDNWGMAAPGGQPAQQQRQPLTEGLRPNPVASPSFNKFKFFTKRPGNGTATNNLPGSAGFRPGRVRLPSSFKNRQPYNRRPMPGNRFASGSPTDLNGMVRKRVPPAPVGAEPGMKADARAGAGGAAATKQPEQSGQEYVNKQQHDSASVGSIDVLGSIPSGKQYQTFMDVADSGGNFSIVFAICAGHLEIDVRVEEESLFDYSNMRRRRRQAHGLRLRYQTPFIHDETGLGQGEEATALGAMTELDLEPGRYYMTVINEGDQLGQFGLYATRNLHTMLYPILPEDAMIRVTAIRPNQLLVTWPATLDADRSRIEYCVMTTESSQWRHRVLTNTCDKFRAAASRETTTGKRAGAGSNAPAREQVCTSSTSITLKRLKPATAYHVEVEARNVITGRYVPYIATRAVTSEQGVTLRDAQELREAAVDGYSKRVFTFDTTHRVVERAPLSVTVSSCNALHGWLLTRDGIHVAQRGPPTTESSHGGGGASSPSPSPSSASSPKLMVPDAAITHALQPEAHANLSFPQPHLRQSSYETLEAERGVYQLTVYNHGPGAMTVDIFATTSLSEKPFPTIPQADGDILVQNVSCDSAVLNWHEGLGTTNVTYCLMLTVGYQPSTLLTSSLNACGGETAYSVVYDMLQGAACSSETERAVSLKDGGSAQHAADVNATDPITAEVVAVNTHTRRVVVYPPSTFSCNRTLALMASSASPSFARSGFEAFVSVLLAAVMTVASSLLGI